MSKFGVRKHGQLLRRRMDGRRTGTKLGDDLDTVRDAQISTQDDGDDFIHSSLNASPFFGSVSSRAAVGGSLFSESEEFVNRD